MTDYRAGLDRIWDAMKRGSCIASIGGLAFLGAVAGNSAAQAKTADGKYLIKVTTQLVGLWSEQETLRIRPGRLHP